MDPPAYVQQGAVDLLHVFQVSLSCWPYAAPPSADDMLAVEIALRDTLAGEAAANARLIDKLRSGALTTAASACLWDWIGPVHKYRIADPERADASFVAYQECQGHRVPRYRR